MSDEEPNDCVRIQYEYSAHSFVAVKAVSEGELLRYWIGKFLRVLRDKSGLVSSISVHWFEPYGEQMWVTAKYAPAYKPVNRSRLEHPWKEDVSTDSVIFNFNRLTKSRHLPMSVKIKLRRELNTSPSQTKNIRPVRNIGRSSIRGAP